MVHIWPYVDEAKLRLRDSMFLIISNYYKDVKKFLKMEKDYCHASQTRFGFTNMGSNMTVSVLRQFLSDIIQMEHPVAVRSVHF